jgi:hypothetical protein
MSDSDLPVSVALGVGLAAATGFRVFLPMLVVSAAAYSGHLSLGDSFGWQLQATAQLVMVHMLYCFRYVARGRRWAADELSSYTASEDPLLQTERCSR